ncbi:hypothetical protein PHET_03850 [Paragonimus heterotremus]|uniref:mitogen-activated protein kinase kinase kinase n=1 Tax=Paragonimus heterotremus TaxID=100268 RepID=A0A8J4SMX4_9TREM|nr:hypothetical protein PHET_03850 [Paragonimus heterotremus]
MPVAKTPDEAVPSSSSDILLSPSKNTYLTVLYEYTPQHPDEIELRLGDKLKLLSCDHRDSGDKGWWVGQEPNNGRIGVFPSAYVSVGTSAVVDGNGGDVPSIADEDMEDHLFSSNENQHEVCPHSITDPSVKPDNCSNTPSDLGSSSPHDSMSHIHSAPVLPVELDQQLPLIDSSEIDQQQLKFIGCGAFGTVYQGQWHGKAVALKVLNFVANQSSETASIEFLFLIREPLTKPYVDQELRRCTLLITDFGMACRSSELIVSQQSKLGTVAYAAPEVCRQASFSCKSDVWSYGVVLWELLISEPPFRYVEQPRLLYIIAMRNYTLHVPNTVPSTFAKLLQDCWSVNPDDRPSFEEILTRLDQSNNEEFLGMESATLSRLQSQWREAAEAVTLSSSITDTSQRDSVEEANGDESVADLTFEKELLQCGWDSLSQHWRQLAARAHEIDRKEETYTRMMGTIGQHFTLLAVLAANQLKVPLATQPSKPKPPPPRKRPFVRNLFRRAHNHQTESTPEGTRQYSKLTPPVPEDITTGENRKVSVGSLRGTTVTAASSKSTGSQGGATVIADGAVSSQAQSIEAFPLASFGSHRLGCSRGGIPHISPPLDMKHLVHVDHDWVTGHGLSDTSLRLFPAALAAAAAAASTVGAGGSTTDCSSVLFPWDRSCSPSATSPRERHPCACQSIKTDLSPTVDKMTPACSQCARLLSPVFVEPALTDRSIDRGDTRLGMDNQSCSTVSTSSTSIDRFGLRTPVGKSHRGPPRLLSGQRTAAASGVSVDPGDVLVRTSSRSCGCSNFFTHSRPQQTLGEPSNVYPGCGNTYRDDPAFSPPPHRSTQYRRAATIDRSMALHSGENPIPMGHALIPGDQAAESTDLTDRRRSASGYDASCLSSAHGHSYHKCSTCSTSKLSAFATAAMQLTGPALLDTRQRRRIQSVDRCDPPTVCQCGRVAVLPKLPDACTIAHQAEIGLTRALPAVIPNGLAVSLQYHSQSAFGTRNTSVLIYISRSAPRAVMLEVSTYFPVDAHVTQYCAWKLSFPQLSANTDPHSPFLGMLAGSGRRPNPSLSGNDPKSSNPKTLSPSTYPTCWLCSHNQIPRSTPQCRHFLTSSDQTHRRHCVLQRCAIPVSSEASPYVSNETATCNTCYCSCRNQDIAGQCYLRSSSTSSSSSSIGVQTDSRQVIRSRTPHPPCTAMTRWHLPASVESTRSDISADPIHMCCSETQDSDVRLAAEQSVLSWTHLCAERETPVVKLKADSHPSLSVESYNPVAHSRDAYLKATQDGYLNRVAHIPKTLETQKEHDSSALNSLTASTLRNQSLPLVYLDAHEPLDVVRSTKDRAKLSPNLPESGDSDSDIEFLIPCPRGQEEDGLTLVPADGWGVHVPNTAPSPSFDQENSLENDVSKRTAREHLTSPDQRRLPRRPLHRSPAMRTVRRPDFLFVRNRSLPERFDVPSSQPTVCCTTPSKTPISLPTVTHRKPSPCGPFVSLHSTML